MFQAPCPCVLELMKDDGSVREKSDKYLLDVQMKPTESKRGRACACVHIECAHVNERACVFGVAAQQLV